MATITSAQSGNWSAGATWVGSVVPASGDTVNIAATHVITFDVNQSGFASGITLNVQLGGVFQASTVPGSYLLKIGGNSTITGSFLVGASDAPYPPDCSFKVFFPGNNQFNGAGLVEIYDSEPTILYCKLAQAALTGATSLSVDTDLTTDLYWSTAAVKNVLLEINNAVRDSRTTVRHTCTAVASGPNTITITPALAAGKAIGSYVGLVSRNVEIYGNGGANAFYQMGAIPGFARCSFHDLSYCVHSCHHFTLDGVGARCSAILYNCNNSICNTFNVGLTSACGQQDTLCTFNGKVVSCGQWYAISGCSLCVINGDVEFMGGASSDNMNCTFNGDFYGLLTGIAENAGGCIFNGSISNCANGLLTAWGATVNGRIQNCDTGVNAPLHLTINGGITGCGIAINNCRGTVFINGNVISRNTWGIYASHCTCNGVAFSLNTSGDMYASSGCAINCTFGSPTQHGNYATNGILAYFESLNNGNQVGAFRAWTGGGIVDSDVSMKARVRSFKHACTSEFVPVYMNRNYTVEPGETFRVRTWVRKNCTMTYLPRVQLVIKSGAVPNSTVTPLAEATLPYYDIDVWTPLEVSYTNNTTAILPVIFRTIAKSASGNVWFEPEVIQMKESW